MTEGPPALVEERTAPQARLTFAKARIDGIDKRQPPKEPPKEPMQAGEREHPAKFPNSISRSLEMKLISNNRRCSRLRKTRDRRNCADAGKAP
jgi:hypothetical protein